MTTDGKTADLAGIGAGSAPRDWGKWRDYRATHFAGFEDAILVACRTCKRPTDDTSAKLCDGCWEVEHRLDGYLRDGGGNAITKLLMALGEADADGPCGECGHTYPLLHLAERP